ncbi:1,6-anhydro-N-acetylmuramyl-L-alanine amidase AmpD [Acerihabitans sp. TG2]|uniref:1,6-anhydro-N-acetylmuramyl-L-alanine amidase AmpD n=1 Tax=Acerihabitans sp. TG2 TaxID=3096008 RepID=UPI002B23DBE2|nr:1,6-anhydro-N-acetylmuramyl-L-alanine amidase AmpD [Acerihabitans sp. TG2]MEA9391802.1 1,6-anhydro-N-acetylmuramyl-L-alanine amidase AmpD [Acerihabitans sp. TG2]
MQLINSWISGVKRVPSPYCDARPHHEAPSLLVVHGISLPPGQFGGPYIDQLFTGTLRLDDEHPFFQQVYELRVSAHCLIRRAGDVVQYVPFDKRAWHAGASMFAGRPNCNDFSIGIELEGTDNLAYTQEQYRSLAEMTRLLMQHYPIVPQRIIGHSDIAPDRKTDPGPEFNWHCYRQLLSPRADGDNRENPAL